MWRKISKNKKIWPKNYIFEAVRGGGVMSKKCTKVAENSSQIKKNCWKMVGNWPEHEKI